MIDTSVWINVFRDHTGVAKAALADLIDCCIAQLAITNQVLLVHDDRDFDAIAQVQPLQHIRLRTRGLTDE